MAHILVIVAQHYNGNELWPMLKALQHEGHTWVIAADKPVIADERTMKAYRVTDVIENITYDGFDGLVFISGNPHDTQAHWKHKRCNELVRQAAAKKHPLAAICAAVPSLGPAIEFYHVSAFPLRTVCEALIEAGAIIDPVSLTTDRNVVTAENEAMTFMWAQNFCCVLRNEPPKYVLTPSPFKRKRREKRPIPVVEYARRQNVSGK